MSALFIWLGGDCDHPDFAAPLAWLNGRAECCAICSEDGATLSEMRCGSQPDGVVWFQSRSGQITQGVIEKIHATAPLARLVLFTGPWCEGELRTGRPVAGVVRVPWRAWSYRLPSALGLEPISAARWPRTATEVERIEGGLRKLPRADFAGLEAVIHSASRAAYEAIADGLRSLAVTSIWHETAAPQQRERAPVAIFDGWDQYFASDLAGAAALQARLLLLHFPRPEDIQQAGQLGIRAVLALPLLLPDLAAALAGVRYHADVQLDFARHSG